MNTTTLKTASERGGPAVLGAGVAMLTVALITSSHGRVSAAARPAPTVTTTVTAPAGPAPASTTAVARPGATPTPATVLAVSERIAAMPHNGDGDLSHAEARPPSTPAPSPAAAPCSGQALSVRLRAACVSIGGGS